MSILKKMSRKSNKEKQNKPVSTRLTDSEFEAFTKLCEETGYTISEALRLLIQQEINELDVRNNTKSLQVSTNSIESIPKSIQLNTDVNKPILPSDKSSTNVNKTKTKSSSSRFSTKEWKINNFLPCPICNTWVSASNFSRHAKEHNYTTEEVFTKYKDKADQMTKERKSKL